MLNAVGCVSRVFFRDGIFLNYKKMLNFFTTISIGMIFFKSFDIKPRVVGMVKSPKTLKISLMLADIFLVCFSEIEVLVIPKK